MDVLTLVGWYGLLYIFGLGIAEVLWHHRKGLTYDWRESAVSVVDLFIRKGSYIAIGGGLFAWLAPLMQPYALADLPLNVNGVWIWGRVFGLFFGLEFLYYWMHRWDHEMRWFWATHAVHHTPNSMNFFTAVRLGWTQTLSGAVITMMPLIIAGFHPRDVLAMLAANLLYQYWLHTEMIGRLGWFECVFNTPSHHRAHHGSNPVYLDKNYGGVLIIFDRMFGTFVRENEKVIYGLVTPVRSLNPVYVALHEWINILGDVRDNWRHPSRIPGYLFGRPGWSHEGARSTTAYVLAEVVESNTNIKYVLKPNEATPGEA
jgi:sterol desaturase/sphingolipid hydroxylase (fatty acid hydroxylase superfamily)